MDVVMIENKLIDSMKQVLDCLDKNIFSPEIMCSVKPANVTYVLNFEKNKVMKIVI